MAKNKNNIDPLVECDNWLDAEETTEETYANKLRKATVGRPRKLESPEALWGFFCDYVEEETNNPFYKQEAIKSGERAGQLIAIPTFKPLTWQGFSSYLFINKIIARIDDYKANTNNSYTEFSSIITCIGEAMYAQKLSGAATGAFNPNIIARELGLAEKTVQDVTTRDETQIDYSKLSPEALEEIASQLNQKAEK